MSAQCGVKFPYLTDVRRILWYEVVCWGYFWGLTEPQVDLLLADQPVVNYKSRKEKKSGDKPSGKRIREAAERWRKKYGEAEQNGEQKKIKINLSGFTMSTPEKETT